MKYTYKFNSVLLFTVMLVFVWSCKPKKELSKAPENTKCKEEITYAKDIAPIINQNCAATCHSAIKKAYGIDLSTYEGLASEAPKKRFMGSLNHEGLYPKMPKKAEKLDSSTLAKINCWIETGMKP
ncbi:MAG: hypothetical protein Q8K70_07625 [Bacteroidota bacterium]|nr:hypothetical protein [Bacteroidota bacterium]